MVLSIIIIPSLNIELYSQIHTPYAIYTLNSFEQLQFTYAMPDSFIPIVVYAKYTHIIRVQTDLMRLLQIPTDCLKNICKFDVNNDESKFPV